MKVTNEISNIRTLSESLAVHLILMNFLKTVEISQLVLSEKEQKASSAANNQQQPSSKVKTSSAQNNFQDNGSSSNANANQNAKDTAFNYLKMRVFEAFEPYETCGIFHQISSLLRLPPALRDMPLLTNIESSKFGEEIYYRVWLTFDNNHSRERELIWDVQDKLVSGPQHVNSAISMSDRKESKLTDSESKGEGGDKKYTASFGSQDEEIVITKNLVALDDQNSATSFEKILRKAKEMTPIMTLLQEASERPYPEHMKAAFKWLEDFYKKQDNLDSQRDAVKIGSLKEIPIPPPQSVKQGLNTTTQDESRLMKDVTIDSNFFEQSISEQKQSSSAVIKLTKLGDGNEPESNNHLDYTIEHPDDNKHKRPLAPSRSNSGSRKSSLKAPKKDNLGSFKLHSEEVTKSLMKSKTGRSGEQTASRLTGTKTQDSELVNSSPNKPSLIDNKDVYSIIPIKKSSMKDSKKSSETKRGDTRGDGSKQKKKKPGFFGLGTVGTSLFKKKQDPKEKRLAKPTAKQPAKDHNLSRQDTSFSDQKSDVTSKLSQLARNMFGFRNGRAGNVGDNMNTNIDNKEDLTPMVITKLAADHALISHDPKNINLITRYISDFKLIRRTETNPEGEKNASGSTKSTSWRGSHFLKMVSSIMETKKGGSHVYTFSLVTVAFTLYFGIVLQYVLSSLKSYNVSNLNNFILLSNFIFLDRKLMEICETQDFLYEHTAAAWNKTEYDMIRQNYAQVLPKGINSTDFLFSRMTETVTDIQVALRAVTDETINLIDKKDAGDVIAATHRKQELDYTDRLSTQSDVYKAWVMPYFTTVNYYMDVFSQNTVTMKDISQYAWQNNYNMDTVNAVMQEHWTKVGRSKIGLDSTVFNKVLRNMGPNFNSMVENIILSAVDRHFKDVYTLLYVSVGVLVVLMGYTLYATIQINLSQQDFLMNYNLLKPWELYLMVEDLSKQRTVFTKYALNEVQLLNQYLDFNLFASLATYANRAARLQDLFSKDKDKGTRIKKYTHDFFFFSSKFIWMIVLMTMVIFGLMGLAIYIFLNINNSRIGVEKLLFDSHVLMIGIMKSYLSVTLLAIYGYFLPIAGNVIEKNTLNSAFDAFLVFQTSKRQEFYAYFGTEAASKVDAISFNDICSWMVSIPSLKEKLGRYVNICKTINNGSATKGIIGFFQFQKYFIDGITSKVIQNYPDFLTVSKTSIPPKALTNELFTSSFIEMRLGNWIVFNVYYYVMSQVATETVTKIMLDLEYYVGKVIQYIAVGLYLSLAAMYAFVINRQAYEIQICYETFKLIDPFFLMNNRYLQFRFKAAFRGVGHRCDCVAVYRVTN